MNDQKLAVPIIDAFTKYPQFILRQGKLPIDYRTVQAGNPHDPALWMDFKTAKRTADLYGDEYGIGFVFTDNDPFFFLDIDGCREGDGWSKMALGLVKWLPGACVEVSQSGNGLHIFGQYAGARPEHGCRNTALGLELYTSKRFVALTGNARGDANTDCTATLTSVITEYFPPTASGCAAEWTDEPVEGYTSMLDDAALIKKALECRSSAASALGGRASFVDLWSGDISKHNNDASSADMALAQHLAFWTGGNCERMLTLMRRSDLVRPKWDRVDYMQRTICNAVGLQKSFFSVPNVAGAAEAVQDQVLNMSKAKRQTVFDVNDILLGDFPPPRFLIPGIIPEGCGIIAGPPKRGKSFLALNIACAIATGEPFFGRIATQSNVLCYCLEDHQGRLKHRLSRMMPQAPQRGVFTIETATEPLPGFTSLLAVALKTTGAKFVLIDTLACVRSPARGNADIYQADYSTIAAIRDTCQDAGASAIIIHHTRKSAAEDQFDRISGSTGLTGAGDYNIILDKNQTQGGVLHGSIRDGEGYELAVSFNKNTFIWECLGGAATVRTNDNQQKIIDVLKEATGSLTPKQITASTEIKSDLVRKTLERLVDDDIIDRPKYGHYILSQSSQCHNSNNAANCDTVTGVTNIEGDKRELDDDVA